MPHLYDVGCISHMADLTIKAGMETLPVNIDQVFVDIFYYFYHSSKRGQLFVDHWCSLFDSEPKAILKHCTTRWLSLLRCTCRFIDQFDGLTSFFPVKNKWKRLLASQKGYKILLPNFFFTSWLLYYHL